MNELFTRTAPPLWMLASSNWKYIFCLISRGTFSSISNKSFFKVLIISSQWGFLWKKLWSKNIIQYLYFLWILFTVYHPLRIFSRQILEFCVSLFVGFLLYLFYNNFIVLIFSTTISSLCCIRSTTVILKSLFVVVTSVFIATHFGYLPFITIAVSLTEWVLLPNNNKGSLFPWNFSNWKCM